MAASPNVEALTAREQEVLRYIANGYSYAEISMVLHIQQTTIKFHVQTIYDKLQLDSGERTHRALIARARAMDLVDAVNHPSWIIPDAPNPYKGLRPFQQSDAPNFFGRDALIKHLLARLREPDDYSRFLAVVGPSGCGKSSLIHAGLLPALLANSNDHSTNWVVADMIPGPHPLDELEIALTRIAVIPGADIHEQLQRDERGLQRIASMILPEGTNLLLIVDQFEELFSMVAEETRRRQFLDLLVATVTHPHSRGWIVIGLRADFYDRPLLYPAFGEMMRQRTEVVMPLGPDELEQAIRKPAQNVSVKVEPGLAAAVVAEVSGHPGSLPLMQYSLTEVFNRRSEHGMTLAAYQQIGGIQRALTRRADAFYEGLGESDQQVLRQLFLRLVTLGEGTEDLRRRVQLSELLSVGDPNRANQLIMDFAGHRLLTLSRDAVGSTVEVAHEALIRHWELLRSWLDESRTDIRLQRMLAAGASEWQNAGQDRSYLLHGSRLAQFEGWVQSAGITLTDSEHAFLNTSIAEKNRQLRQRQLIRRGVAIAAVILAIVFAGLAFQANIERVRAETAEQEALRQVSIGLASIALREMDNGEQDRAVLIALEALEYYPYTGQAESALAEILEDYQPYRMITDIWFGAAAWSPDGRLFGKSNETNFIVLDAVTGEERLRIPQAECYYNNLDFSPSGDQVAVLSMPFSVPQDDPAYEMCLFTKIFDVETGQILHHLRGTDRDKQVDWSPIGSLILTVGFSDGIVRIWDAATGSEVAVLQNPQSQVNQAVWSQDGSQIAAAAADGTVWIWDFETQNILQTFSGHIGGVTSVNWSPEGDRIVTAGEDGTVRVWDIASGVVLLVFSGHADKVFAAEWSPTADHIASAGKDGNGFLWEASTGNILETFHNLGVGMDQITITDPIWSPDGNWLGFARMYATPVLWNATAQPFKLADPADELMDVQWSPDGSLIAGTSAVEGDGFGGTGTIRIWDGITGELRMLLNTPSGIYYFGWSPDSRHIVTPGWDRIVRIWDVSTGEITLQVSLPLEDVFNVAAAWSPDGTRIISNTNDITGPYDPTYIWDADSGELLVTLESNCNLHAPSWNPASDRIVTGCFLPPDDYGPNTPVIIWDAVTGERLMDLESEDGWTMMAEYSPDGTQIAAGYQGGSVRIWDAVTGDLIRTLTAHTASTFAISWSPDGQRLATGDLDGIVRIWDTDTGTEVFRFAGASQILRIHWSPDGSYIITADRSEAPTIRRVWPSTQALMDEAYACCVTRELTPEELTQFGLPARER